MPGQYSADPAKHTLQPIVTGATVIGVKFDGGVLVACDTQASYGSMARYKEFTRIRKVGENCLLGASGEMSDFQYLGKLLDELHDEDWLNQDGCMMGPSEYASYIGRVMYNRRSKGNPLYNQLVVAGKKEGSPPLLAFVDHQGTYYEENFIATGFGTYLAMPMLREAERLKVEALSDAEKQAVKEGKKQIFTKAEAEDLIKKCLQVCFYRDCKAYWKIQMACADGVSTTISEPLPLEHKWDHSFWTEKRLEPGSQRGSDSTW